MRQYETEDGRFLIHWTDQGEDALEYLDDGDGNGRIDALEEVERGLVLCWQRYVEELGWRPPDPDGGRGGDDRIDVYLREIDANGYAYSEPGSAGGTSGYMELWPGLPDTELPLMASVAAHELHHLLQFAFTDRGHPWVFEASATYAQYELVQTPLLDLARDGLWAIRFADMERGLAATGERYEYAGLVWIKYLIDRAGDPAILLDWWGAWEEGGRWQGSLEDALETHGIGSLADAFLDHLEWNWFACGRDDGAHYVDDALACGIETLIWPAAERFEGRDGASFSVTLPVNDWSGLAIELPESDLADESGRMALRCEAAGSRLALAALTVDRDRLLGRADSGYQDGIAELELDWAPGDDLVLLVAQEQAGAADLVCDWSEVVPEPEPEPEPTGCGCSQRGSSEGRAPAGVPGAGLSILGLAWLVGWIRRSGAARNQPETKKLHGL